MADLVPSHGQSVIGSFALPQVYGPGVELQISVPFSPSSFLSRHIASLSPLFQAAMDSGVQSTGTLDPFASVWWPQMRVRRRLFFERRSPSTRRSRTGQLRM